MLDAQLGEGLIAWRAHLAETDTVMKARARAAEMLRGRLKDATVAESKANGLRQEAERLDSQLTAARHREVQRGTDLANASADYAGQVRSWARRLPDQARLITLLHLPEDDNLPPEDRALGRRHTRGCQQGRARDHRPGACGIRDRARRRARTGTRCRGPTHCRTCGKAALGGQKDPELPRSPFASADRAHGAGAPLFLLVDFTDSLGEADRTGLEAALEASGLLSAWTCADGTMLAEGTRDVVLRSGDPVPGPSLSDVLRPVPGHGVSQATVDRLLRCIGLGDSAADSWVARNGGRRLGVARGAFGKDQAEYIGAGVRAATRERRIAELTEQIGELTADLERVAAARMDIERLRDGLRLALRELPPGTALTRAWTAYDGAIAETARLSGELSAARREAEQAAATAVALWTRAQAQATSDGLPADPDLLARLRSSLDGLHTAVDAFGRDAGRVLSRLDTHARTRRSWEAARQARSGAEGDYATAHAKLAIARRELQRLEDSVGASEKEIIAREKDAQGRLDEALRQLPRAGSDLTHARDARVGAEVERREVIRALAEQEQLVVTGGGGLRRPLGLVGLPMAARLGDDVSALLDRYDEAQDGDVRTRITALRALADHIDTRLGPASADVSDSLILRRAQELRDGLAGGYDAESDEIGGIKRFELRDDTGAHDVAS